MYRGRVKGRSKRIEKGRKEKRRTMRNVSTMTQQPSIRRSGTRPRNEESETFFRTTERTDLDKRCSVRVTSRKAFDFLSGSLCAQPRLVRSCSSMSRRPERTHYWQNETESTEQFEQRRPECSKSSVLSTCKNQRSECCSSRAVCELGARSAERRKEQRSERLERWGIWIEANLIRASEERRLTRNNVGVGADR